MASERKRFETLEEMAAFVVGASNWILERKYLLDVRKEQEYIDKSAGEAWRNKVREMRSRKDVYEHNGWDINRAMRDYNDAKLTKPELTLEAYANTLRSMPEQYSKSLKDIADALLMSEDDRRVMWQICADELDNEYSNEPAKHIVEYWSLKTASSGRYSDGFNLSAELGNQLSKIWKQDTRHAWRGDFSGYKTLQGILKALGRTDIAQLVKSAQAAAEAQKQKNSRNYVRREINAKLAEIEKLVNQHGATLGITVEMFQLPTELADKLTEEA